MRFSRKWFFITVFVISLVLCVAYFYDYKAEFSPDVINYYGHQRKSFYQAKALAKHPSWKSNDMLERYCHSSLLTSVTGREGVIDSSRYKLIQVHAVLRHGDRNTVSRIKYRPKVHLECGMVDNNSMWKDLDKFKIKPLPSSAKIINGNINLFNGFKSLSCKKHQLTFRGFKQLYNLGSFLSGSYIKQLSLDPQAIYVQSTDYKRTIQSAAAFMLGFLPKETHKNNIPIHIHEDYLLETAPPEIPSVYPLCNLLGKMMRRDFHRLQHFNQKMKPLIDEVMKVSNVKKFRPLIKEVFDSLWPRLCHDKELPCGPSGCINESYLEPIAKGVNWMSLHQYQNSTSILAMQPFVFHSILSQMDAAISSSINSRPYKQFIFSFAHDTTISMLMASFGIPQSYWIPYASRLVIELWKDGQSKDSLGRSSYYVRVLFNGDGMVKHLPLPTSDFSPDGLMVAYNSWKKYLVTGNFRDFNLYRNSCEGTGLGT
jgi:hypothetical protein